MTNFSTFSEAVVDVPEVHGEPHDVCCEWASSQELVSAVVLSRMGGRVGTSDSQEEEIRMSGGVC